MENTITVILPVVTTVMERSEGSGSYLHDSSILTISSYVSTINAFDSIATSVVDTSVPHNLSLGDLIYVTGCRLTPGTVSFGQINGIFKVSAVNSDTEIEFIIELGNSSTTISETIIPGTLQSLNAPVNTSFPGPYVFDPVSGIPISNIATTTTNDLDRNTSTKYLGVVSTSGWNMDGGYLAIGFGTSVFDRPIKYSGILNTTTLILDQSYIFPMTVVAGTSVTMLFQKGPWVPDNITEVGAFWATDDSSGVKACISAIDQSVASGVSVDYEIKYPSDIGLGAAGYPTKGTGKVSSIVNVYDMEGVD